MVKAFVGSGGKTTLIRQQAESCRRQGLSVFVTTTTHMYPEAETLLTDDPQVILQQLERTGYAMAGTPAGEKIGPLSAQTYRAVCAAADVVLVEADGSKRMPLKYPAPHEPVIPENAEQITVVCGVHGLGKPARQVCHRLELVMACLGIRADTPMEPEHIRRLVVEGYLRPLREAYPQAIITVSPVHDGSRKQAEAAAMLEKL